MNYKGFNKDMTCRGFQFEEGKEYEEPVARVCDSGFHSCEYPLDCFKHYSPASSVYHEVEASGDISKENEGDDTKLASTKIKIGAEINIAGLVKAAIEYTTKRTKKEQDSSGNCGASSATGDRGASSATGNCGASSATGYRGASSAGHANAVAVAWGIESKAKGVLGSHLVFAIWEKVCDSPKFLDQYELKGAKMVRVDGEDIKADVWYTISGGEIVKAEERTEVILWQSFTSAISRLRV